MFVIKFSVCICKTINLCKDIFSFERKPKVEIEGKRYSFKRLEHHKIHEKSIEKTCEGVELKLTLSFSVMDNYPF